METAYSFRATLKHKQYVFVAPFCNKKATYTFEVETEEIVEAHLIESKSVSLELVIPVVEMHFYNLEDEMIISAELVGLEEITNEQAVNTEIINWHCSKKALILNSKIIESSSGYEEKEQLALIISLDTSVRKGILTFCNELEISLLQLQSAKINSYIIENVAHTQIIPTYVAGNVNLDNFYHPVTIIEGKLFVVSKVYHEKWTYIAVFNESLTKRMQEIELKAEIVEFNGLFESALPTNLVTLDGYIKILLLESAETITTTDEWRSSIEVGALEYNYFQSNDVDKVLPTNEYKQDIYDKKIIIVDTHTYELYGFEKNIKVINTNEYKEIEATKIIQTINTNECFPLNYCNKLNIVLTDEFNGNEYVVKTLILSTKDYKYGDYQTELMIESNFFDSDGYVRCKTIGTNLIHDDRNIPSNYLDTFENIMHGNSSSVIVNGKAISNDGYTPTNCINADLVELNQHNYVSLINTEIIIYLSHYNETTINTNITELDGQNEAALKTHLVDLTPINIGENSVSSEIIGTENSSGNNNFVLTKEYENEKSSEKVGIVAVNEHNHDGYSSELHVLNGTVYEKSYFVHLLKTIEAINLALSEINNKAIIVVSSEIIKNDGEHVDKIIEGDVFFYEAVVGKELFIATNGIIDDSKTSNSEVKGIVLHNDDFALKVTEFSTNLVDDDNKSSGNDVIVAFQIDKEDITTSNGILSTHYVEEQSHQTGIDEITTQLIENGKSLHREPVIQSDFVVLEGQNEAAVPTNLISLDNIDVTDVPIVAHQPDLDIVNASGNVFLSNPVENEKSVTTNQLEANRVSLVSNNSETTLVADENKNETFGHESILNTQEVALTQSNFINMLGVVEIDNESYLAVNFINANDVQNQTHTPVNYLNTSLVTIDEYKPVNYIAAIGLQLDDYEPVNYIVVHVPINQEYKPVNYLKTHEVINQEYIPVNVLKTNLIENREYIPVNVLPVSDVINTKLEAVNNLVSIIVELNDYELKELIVDSKVIELESLNLIDNNKEKRKIWLIPARANWYSKWFTKKTR